MGGGHSQNLGARLDYHLIIRALIGECPHHGAFTLRFKPPLSLIIVNSDHAKVERRGDHKTLGYIRIVVILYFDKFCFFLTQKLGNFGK